MGGALAGAALALQSDRVAESLPTFDDEGGDIPIDVRELLLWNIDFVLHKGKDSISLSRFDLSMRPNDDDARTVQLSIGSATINVGGTSLAFEVAVDAA